ncbi:hypothetical protein AB0G20_18420 [Streptomyces sp. NPDC024017]|uniref:hypothetical protein n=1 Tax=Streptomyces sp. NPDC024017 TaxID=3154326 RepID=UPI0033FFC9E9
MNIKEVMQNIVRDNFVARVSEELGDEGLTRLRGFLSKIRTIYSAIDYESISTSLTVVSKTTDEVCLPAQKCYRTDEPAELALHNAGVLTVQVLGNGDLLVLKEEIDLDQINQGAMVYRFTPAAGEQFWVDAKEARVQSMSGYPLLFATPSFRDLSEALNHYRTHIARPSECAVLSTLWREAGRVMWKPAPEASMQRSLYFFLKCTLRDGHPDIRQETPVDDKNPVDLEVQWSGSNRIALIEVKWLGKSGTLNPPKLGTEYSEKRAKEGLAQLADYLDRTRGRAPYKDRRGYLVIFDARRSRVKAETLVLDRNNGFHFEDAHIDFQADILERHDIAEPVRCFCEPSLSAGQAPSSMPVTD